MLVSTESHVLALAREERKVGADGDIKKFYSKVLKKTEG